MPQNAPAEEPDEPLPIGGILRDRWRGLGRFFTPDATFEATRLFFLRLLGILYAFAFLVLVLQGPGLLGKDGLLPAGEYVARVVKTFGVRGSFTQTPSLFFLIGASDQALSVCASLGLGLSILVALGLTNAIAQLVLWALYLSFVHVGQVFYGYGWESLLCETGFLAIFLCPLTGLSPVPKASVPRVPIWLLRWLTFRVMLGAGLIKLRGDPCWKDLTCLVYHYETQPSPNPLSFLFHSLPPWVLKGGVLFNHVAELVAPFFVFGPRKARHAAGIVIIVFQLLLILSGNLSFFNWLTIVAALACFDDSLSGRLLPKRLRERVVGVARAPSPLSANVTSYALAFVVGVLSISPTLNLLSSRQTMNGSFDPLRLVNTYGAFGGVGRERFEVILEGTSSPDPGPGAEWREYEFPCKPGDPTRRPCVASPYHYRLDWQLWFASFRGYKGDPWIVNLAYKLLRGEPTVKTLLAKDPFPSEPPRYIRATLYKYELLRVGEGPGAWRRRATSELLKPLSVTDPAMLRFLAAHRYIPESQAPPAPEPPTPPQEE